MSGNRSNRIFMGVLLFFQLQRSRIDAVAQSGGRWAVGKDVAEMGAAVLAGHFSANHAVTAIVVFRYIFFLERGREAGPAAAGIEFLLRRKQRFAATDAAVDAVFVAIPVFAAEGVFGTLL